MEDRRTGKTAQQATRSSQKPPNRNNNTKRPPAHRPSPAHSKKRPKYSPYDAFPHVTNPDQHANRITKRQREIEKGKNTTGYDAYRTQVPLASRRPRSMDTPSTPQPTWDVSVKQWTGLVRAWRRALHKYDPPELTQTGEIVALEETTPISIASPPETMQSPTGKSSPVRALDFGAGDSSDDDDDDDDDLL